MRKTERAKVVNLDILNPYLVPNQTPARPSASLPRYGPPALPPFRPAVSPPLQLSSPYSSNLLYIQPLISLQKTNDGSKKPLTLLGMYIWTNKNEIEISDLVS